tara:strand:+ start:1108 stop:1563 length:456 start_codon:yes stop_codon:yes gene_type:complete
MSILKTLNNLSKVTATAARVQMTDEQVVSCKAAIKRDNRGYNVQPNRFDITAPYRVAINFDNNWHNFGDFASADVAAAVGTIVSAAFFGEKAKLGNFSEDVVEADQTFAAWIADSRNADVISRAGDATQSYMATGTAPQKASKPVADDFLF